MSSGTEDLKVFFDKNNPEIIELFKTKKNELQMAYDMLMKHMDKSSTVEIFAKSLQSMHSEVSLLPQSYQDASYKSISHMAKMIQNGSWNNQNWAGIKKATRYEWETCCAQSSKPVN